jgi:hypothetical protein
VLFLGKLWVHQRNGDPPIFVEGYVEDMRNWLAPLTVLGLSGLGLVCASERGRNGLRSLFERVATEGDPIGEVNRFLDDQLNAIQDTLDRLADALEEQEG